MDLVVRLFAELNKEGYCLFRKIHNEMTQTMGIAFVRRTRRTEIDIRMVSMGLKVSTVEGERESGGGRGSWEGEAGMHPSALDMDGVEGDMPCERDTCQI